MQGAVDAQPFEQVATFVRVDGKQREQDRPVGDFTDTLYEQLTLSVDAVRESRCCFLPGIHRGRRILDDAALFIPSGLKSFTRRSTRDLR